MEPGDTIFWHCDVVHAVENEHRGSGYSNVMYIPSAPGCSKEIALIWKDRRSPYYPRWERRRRIFRADNFEVNFVGRGTVANLDERGRAQTGNHGGALQEDAG